MPKKVDHDVQRRRITDAVCSVTLRAGLPAATFRAVAAEAGVSVRLVQYYFGSKEQLRIATLEHVAERSVARMMSWFESTDGSPRQLLGAFLGSFVPDDDDSRLSVLMYVALHTEALFDPSLASEEALSLHRSMKDTIVDLLEQAGAGALVPGLDIDLESAVLTSLMPGLGQSILDGMITTDRAFVLLQYTLDRMFATPASVTVKSLRPDT